MGDRSGRLAKMALVSCVARTSATSSVAAILKSATRSGVKYRSKSHARGGLVPDPSQCSTALAHRQRS